MLKLDAHPKHTQEVEHRAFVESAKLIARPHGHVGPLGNAPIVLLHEIPTDVGHFQERQSLGQDVGAPSTVLSGEMSRARGALLHEMIERLSAVEELIAPIVAIVDKDQEPGANETLGDEELRRAPVLPFPTRIE